MQTHRRGELHIRGTVDGFAILFQPSAVGLLFALPAQEFADQDFDAEQVFGAIIARFHERLADCRTFEERISVANQFLLQRASHPLATESAAATDILRGAGGARIHAMAERAGLGLRQFERRFVQQVGVSPKLFARIAVRSRARPDGPLVAGFMDRGRPSLRLLRPDAHGARLLPIHGRDPDPLGEGGGRRTTSCRCEPLWGENRPMDSNDPSDRKKPTPLEEKAWFQIGLCRSSCDRAGQRVEVGGRTAGDTAVPERSIPI
jgi:hypothetical protein